MSANRNHTLNKAERLCSRLLIDMLFDGKGCTVSSWPLRVVFRFVDGSADSRTPQVELLVSVSKRNFKRAVKRNRVKRQIREAYRKNKGQLLDVMANYPDKRLLMGIIWQDDHLHSSEKVEAKMQNLLLRLEEKVKDKLEGV